MKKITFKILLGLGLLFSTVGQAQCLNSAEGLYPPETSTATTCDGITVTSITPLAYASEYSNVAVVAGETYTFKSSVATDFITISNDDGITASAFGVTPVTWVSDIDGVVRFYTHTNAACGGAQSFRTRSYVCGVPPCTQPVATFSSVADCGNSNFNVITDLTSIGSATSITVSDDQGSTPQTVTTTGTVTFGPYAYGTPVIITVTNDDTPVCNVVSDAQTVLACPPTNDECATAITLTCGDTLTSQTTGGATGGTATSCVGTIGDDIWYTFTGDGLVNTITATAAASSDGAQVEVYESTDGTCGGFTPGSCFASAGSGETTTTVGFVSTVGTVYYVHIGNWINGDPAILFDLTLTCEAPATPPANDDCSGAYALTVNADASCASVVAGDLSGATASVVNETACGGTEDDDVWFSFVATETAHAINLNNVAGSTTDLYHSLWEGDCSGLTLVPNSCSDANSSIPTGLTVGNTYYLRVYSYTDVALQTSTFDVCIGTLPPPPANDECANAVTLNCGDVLTGQSTDSATGGTATSCVGTIGNDIWYSFTGDGMLNTLTATAVGASDGAQVEVYESNDGTCGGFTAGTCFASAGSGETVTNVSFTSTLGTVYYIHIGNWINGDPAITFDLSLTCDTPPTPPANDDCANAEALTLEVSTTGTTIGGTTTTLGLVPTCQTNRGNDVWYTAVVPASGALTITTEEVSGSLLTDTVLTAFSGSCGALTEIGCNDDNVLDTFSTIELTGLNAGDTVLIGVWKYDAVNGDDGEFVVKASDPFLATPTFNSADFKLYPNPVSNVLNISYSKNITAVAVFNLLGQEVIAKTLNTNLSQIDMSHLAKGTYMVKVTANNEVKTMKVIKQ